VVLRLADATIPAPGGGLEAGSDSLPTAWRSGVAIDGDVVASSILDRARSLPRRVAETCVDHDREELGLEVGAQSKLDVAASLDDVAGSPGTRATMRDHARSLRALRMARARRLALAVTAAVSRVS
jgi:hypothetical protein